MPGCGMHSGPKLAFSCASQNEMKTKKQNPIHTYMSYQIKLNQVIKCPVLNGQSNYSNSFDWLKFDLVYLKLICCVSVNGVLACLEIGFIREHIAFPYPQIEELADFIPSLQEPLEKTLSNIVAETEEHNMNARSKQNGNKFFWKLKNVSLGLKLL